jgi:hypothetical protein
MTNYIPDVNRFKLAGPPKWFLIQLMDFDDSLVIVPSRQGFFYRLAQRRKLKLPEHITNEALWNHSDTQMLASYSLVPVTTILATVNWGNPILFNELAERAPWRQGGADKVIKHIEGQEREKELRQQAATAEHLEYLGKDAWKLYRKKIGLGRSWNTSPEGAKSEQKPRVNVRRPFVGFSRSDQL